MESKYNEFIFRKKKEEDTLYSNFVLVLNEKKARIQHLTELLEAFRHGRPTVNPEPQATEKTKKFKKVKVEIKNEVSDTDGEESEVYYSTDDEKSKTHRDKDSAKEDNVEFSNILSGTHLATSTENIPGTSRDYCSALLDDSPPNYALPKRTKYNGKANDIVDTPSYNAAVSNLNIEIMKNEVDDDSSSDSLNTQDLLNDI